MASKELKMHSPKTCVHSNWVGGQIVNKKMNKVSTYKTGRTSTLLVGASGLLLFSLAPLHAQVVMPSNPVVTQGGISIQQTTPSITTITQSTQKAVINWNSFSIGSGNTVQFNLPGSSAIVVNRVTGGGLSQIDGNLLSNGQVWILNPNGLLIGSGGQINTAGFLGTTAGMSDTDFMAGNYRFNDLSLRGTLLNNKGAIVSAVGGYAVLAGRQVINEGLIQANLGSVVLGGARSYALDVVGDKLLSFAVTSPLELATANGRAVLENSGTLQADGGRVQLTARTAKDVIGGVINTTGLVQANNAALVNGTIVLDAGTTGAVNIAGTVSVNHSAGSGGSIAITGGSIVNSGSLMANGLDGGGHISLFASQRLESTGIVSANAGQNGQGGVVTMITDLDNKLGVAAVSGSIFAQGGSLGGNGGFVETSAGILNIGSGLRVNTSAANGKTGNWLLDPINVEVINGGPSTSVVSNTGSTIGADTINSSLITNNVTITTTSAPGTDAGNITISSPLSWSANTLTLKAENSIIINANLIATGTGRLNYFYGLSSTDGAGSSVTVATGIKVEIPHPDNFRWKKGSNPLDTDRGLVLENAFLRFGDGNSSSIISNGNLAAPHYFDASSSTNICANQWCPLSFGSKPLSFAVGLGGVAGSNPWNTDGFVITDGSIYSASSYNEGIRSFSGTQGMELVRSINIAGYKEGLGTISATFKTAGMTAIDSRLLGLDFSITNTYTLSATSRFLKTESKINAVTTLPNVRFWMGIGDDWVGSDDNTLKTKGNISGSTFTPITTQDTQANAVLVGSSNSPPGFALLYSNASGINSVINAGFGFADLAQIIVQDPKTSVISSQSDGAYGLFFNAANSLSRATSASVVTFFGAAPAADLQPLMANLQTLTNTSTGGSTGGSTSTSQQNAAGAISEIVFRPPAQLVPPPPPPATAPPSPPSATAPPPPGSDPASGTAPPPPPSQQENTAATAPPPPPTGSTPPQAPAPGVASGSQQSGIAPAPQQSGPVSTSGPRAPAPVSAPVTPVAAATTPVAPPPPSPVGDVKPPTPKDAADTGDKTLAAAAPPPPPSAASQSKRSNTPASTVKVGSVTVETVAQVNVPAVAGEQRFSLSGNSAAW